MNDLGYYRQPTVAQDRIVFACEDDLWSVGTSGGAATRLTFSFGTCTSPKLSPDARSVAFISTDDGNPELYVMPKAGGVPKRLTHLGSTAATCLGWNADGSEVYVSANAPTGLHGWYERELFAYAVPRDGGEPRALNLGHLLSISHGPDGATALGRNASDPARWKRYRGGTSGEIWVDARGVGDFERVALPDGNPVTPMLIGERLYFNADHEGIGNIYSTTYDGQDIRRHTHEGEYFARFASTDGTRIVYSCGGDIVLYDVATDVATRIDIHAPSAVPQTARRFESDGHMLEHVAVHPDGTRLALVMRGQPFTMPLFDGAVIHHGSTSLHRHRLAEWLPDGKRFLCVTDRNGFEQLAIFDGETQGEPTYICASDIGRVTELCVSPRAELVAFANHRHELCVVDLEDGKVRVIDRSPAHRITDLAISPDGRFIAYVWWPANETSIVRVAKIKSGKIHDITGALRVDRAPTWDPNGEYLYFLSTRDFNPVYDALQFDLSFPQAQRPFLATLRRDVRSPFVPEPKPIHREHEHKHDDDGEKKGNKTEDLTIDFDGISGRILGFPVDEGDYGQLVATKNRVLFTRFEVRGIKPEGKSWDDENGYGTLLAYDFEAQRCGALAHDVTDIRLGSDLHTLVYTSGDRMRVIDAQMDLPEDGDEPKPSMEPGRKSGWLDLDRINVEIQPRQEWSQIYREAWRLQTEQFWVEDMSDIDWDRVYDRYAALLPRIRTRGELSDLIWEMQGELGTSHAYEYGGDYRIPPQYQRGFLGADLTPQADGSYLIERIFRGDSWNREIDSPLAQPGLDIREGDCILAIGGKRLTPEYSAAVALVNAADRDIALTIRNRKNDERTVLVKALESETMLRYRAWVEANRAYVHEHSAGRVGYIHIPDMGPWGFSEFHRGFLNEFDYRGVIVDVRYNRGGHVSPLLLEKLARKRVGYDVPRYGKPLPYPPESVGGPIIALTNQFAGSDGDIFSHCFKLYELGPLIGKRTWGGVIGINPYHRLVDGTITTQPEFSFWFADVGWKVENYGTDPDYDIDIAPQDYRANRDPQLDFGLRLMDSALERAVPLVPDLSRRPSLPLPTLA